MLSRLGCANHIDSIEMSIRRRWITAFSSGANGLGRPVFSTLQGYLESQKYCIGVSLEIQLGFGCHPLLLLSIVADLHRESFRISVDCEF